MKELDAAWTRSSSAEAITAQTRIRDIQKVAPTCRPILEHLGFDLLRESELQLAEACRLRMLEAHTLARTLMAFQQRVSGPPIAVELMSLTELCDHLEEVHHRQIRNDLKELNKAVRGLNLEPGLDETRLTEIRERVRQFSRKLDDHLRAETETLFPVIRHMDTGSFAKADVLERLKTPLARMKVEHNEVDEELAALEALADRRENGDAASLRMRSLNDSLRKLEESLHGEIYQENQILFRRALARAGLPPNELGIE